MGMFGCGAPKEPRVSESV
ncbi:hypothetical protein F383_14469 [Gossypium arboreum]|uniref:Uncharacterized protein n=1 Tax=Gossypium arboreum TaxID=29729 RepID=A0A0B0PZ31_GOSAR|nr:hypothetical protein F383_14469 [Gossypium arboreum]